MDFLFTGFSSYDPAFAGMDGDWIQVKGDRKSHFSSLHRDFHENISRRQYQNVNDVERDGR